MPGSSPRVAIDHVSSNQRSRRSGSYGSALRERPRAPESRAPKTQTQKRRSEGFFAASENKAWMLLPYLPPQISVEGALHQPSDVHRRLAAGRFSRAKKARLESKQPPDEQRSRSAHASPREERSVPATGAECEFPRTHRRRLTALAAIRWTRGEHDGEGNSSGVDGARTSPCP